MQGLLENKTNLLDFEALSLAVEGKAEAAVPPARRVRKRKAKK